jgi:hypothetical protein
VHLGVRGHAESSPFNTTLQNLENGFFSLYLKGERKGVPFEALSGIKKRKPSWFVERLQQAFCPLLIVTIFLIAESVAKSCPLFYLSV